MEHSEGFPNGPDPCRFYCGTGYGVYTASGQEHTRTLLFTPCKRKVVLLSDFRGENRYTLRHEWAPQGYVRNSFMYLLTAVGEGKGL